MNQLEYLANLENLKRNGFSTANEQYSAEYEEATNQYLNQIHNPLASDDDKEIAKLVLEQFQKRLARRSIGSMAYHDDEYDEYGGENPDMESNEYPGYSNADLREFVTFLRPEWCEEEQCFESESKDVHWCLGNGFHEVKPAVKDELTGEIYEESVWAGNWYFRKFPDEKPYQRPPLKKKIEDRLNRNVTEEVFIKVIEKKEEANRYFMAKQYTLALEKYDESLQLLGGDMYTIFLNGKQREEAVKIFSNRSELYLRTKNYLEAGDSASLAITLDVGHQKSLIRRAKASYHMALQQNDHYGPNPLVMSRAIEDLDEIIYKYRERGDGVEEAKALKARIENGLY